MKETLSENLPKVSETVPRSSESFGNVKDAAHAYGCSERTLLNRITAGKIEAFRDGKQWRVRLPEADIRLSDSTSDVSENVPKVSESEAESSEEFPKLSESVPNALEGLVEQLRGENVWLRSQVETHQQNEAELRRLMLADKRELSELREQVKRLAAPPIEESVATATKTVEDNSTPSTLPSSSSANPGVPIQDVQEGAQEARTAQETANAGISAAELEQAMNRPQTGKKSLPIVEVPPKAWWRFWDRD